MNGSSNFLRISLPSLLHHHRHGLARGEITAREILIREHDRAEAMRASWREIFATAPTTKGPQ